MPASVIRHIYYKPEAEELSVWFRDTGRRYKYYDVPKQVYEEFIEAQSRGRFYNENVRGRFESELVEDPRHHSRRQSA